MIEKFDTPIMVTKPFLPPYEEYTNKIKKIWSTNWLTNNGPLHNELELNLKDFLGVLNCSLFTNGHLALEIAIRALGLTGEVITTPFTFASTTHAIFNSGLTPVFCDIDPETFTIDVNKIEKLITKRTSAIIPVHVYGIPCNVKAIESIAHNYNLKILYDAAHVFGVEIDGRGIGTFGDLSMFSMHATKVFHSIEGGLLTYNSNEYDTKLKLLKNFGISSGSESIEIPGINAKMNEFQAAMGLINLPYVNNEINKRKKLVECYREGLSDVSGIRFLNDIPGVKHNYAYFPIIVCGKLFGMTRDMLYNELQKFNVFTRKYFYPLTSNFGCYRHLSSSKPDNLVVSNDLVQKVLTMPLYGELTVDNVNKICNIIRELGLRKM